MYFKDLLKSEDIDPNVSERILVLRHRPKENHLARAMPWIISERPDLFEAYQSVQFRPRNSVNKAEFVASFLGIKPGTAHFVGLYRVREGRKLGYAAFTRIPEYHELKNMGYKFPPTRYEFGKLGKAMRFDLEPLPFYSQWRGRLIVDYPPPEISWFRWLDRTSFPIRAILEESVFTAPPPDWREIDLTFTELVNLPSSWRARLAEWRGIYIIFDETDRRIYVGSAYGEHNILGRWRAYMRTGHGENRELRGRDARNFRFSILERVSPDLPSEEVIARENTWKIRLNSRAPFGLNAN